MSKSNILFIAVPTSIIMQETPKDINKGMVLFLYCYFYRFASRDGYCNCTLEDLANNLGSHFERTKNRNLTKTIKSMIKSLDFMIDNKIIQLSKGDYKSLYYFFQIKINPEYYYLDKNFKLLSYMSFDYLRTLEGRINKSNMFLLLFWIMNCSTQNDDGEIIDACSYSMKYISETLGFAQPSLLKYLSKLCGKPGTVAPLLFFKNQTVKINDRFRRFPNIYVKNDEFAKRNLELQKKYIMRHFIMSKVMDSDNGFLDYEDLY